jgi:hypothetical protein
MALPHESPQVTGDAEPVMLDQGGACTATLVTRDEAKSMGRDLFDIQGAVFNPDAGAAMEKNDGRGPRADRPAKQACAFSAGHEFFGYRQAGKCGIGQLPRLTKGASAGEC